MRTGLFDEGAAWLRMKIDMQSDNTAMVHRLIFEKLLL